MPSSSGRARGAHVAFCVGAIAPLPRVIYHPSLPKA